MINLSTKYTIKKSGFTIVELLVVIVVIAILAAITIVAYTGIAQKAGVAAINTDLVNSAKQLKLYYTDHGSYPTGLDGSYCPTGSAPSPDTRYCLKTSRGATLAYTSSSATTFSLTETNGSLNYVVTESTPPTVAAINNCPSGFIPVPGSATYGTSDFCVMKYEAKNVAGVATSQAASTPWISISQNTAITTSAAACTGCHLITDAEFLTIAQNVLNIPSNWYGGVVGTNYIYSGHNACQPCSALAADTNDSNGYFGETLPDFYGNNAPISNQLRTLTLSNGFVIWDLAGNVNEWTSGQTSGGQPGITGESAYAWKDWTVSTAHGSLSPDPFPATTGISGAGSWTSLNGIGMLYSWAGEGTLHGLVRGGHYLNSADVGVMTLTVFYAPTGTATTVGFRVAK